MPVHNSRWYSVEVWSLALGTCQFYRFRDFIFHLQQHSIDFVISYFIYNSRASI